MEVTYKTLIFILFLCLSGPASAMRAPGITGGFTTNKNDVFVKINGSPKSPEDLMKKVNELLGKDEQFANWNNVARMGQADRKNEMIEIFDQMNVGQFGGKGFGDASTGVKIVERKVTKNGVTTYQKVKMVNGKIVEEINQSPDQKAPVNKLDVGKQPVDDSSDRYMIQAGYVKGPNGWEKKKEEKAVDLVEKTMLEGGYVKNKNGHWVKKEDLAAQEKREEERKEQEKRDQERREKDRRDQEKRDQERREREKRDQERRETERLEREKREQERREQEKRDQEKREQEKLNQKAKILSEEQKLIDAGYVKGQDGRWRKKVDLPEQKFTPPQNNPIPEGKTAFEDAERRKPGIFDKANPTVQVNRQPEIRGHPAGQADQKRPEPLVEKPFAIPKTANKEDLLGGKNDKLPSNDPLTIANQNKNGQGLVVGDSLTDRLAKQGVKINGPPNKPTLGKKSIPPLPSRNPQNNDLTGADLAPVFKARPGSVPPGYVPMEIKWELGASKEYCRKRGRMDLYNHLKNLLVKASGIIRLYVFVPENTPRKTVINAGNTCPEYYLPKSTVYNAHMVMLTRIYDAGQRDENTIAKASACQRDKNMDDRTLIGRIAMNSYKMVLPSDGFQLQSDYLSTIVHETFHALAFNQNAKELLIDKAVDPRLKHLSLIRKVRPEIFDEGHWDEAYIPNDLMTPISRSGNVISIYSLEMLEQKSKGYSTSPMNLPRDVFFDDIDDEESFFRYKCNSRESRSKYNMFCNENQVKTGFSGCSMDYNFVTQCSGNRLENNCFRAYSRPDMNCLDTVVKSDTDHMPFEHRGQDARCFETENKGRSLCLKYEIVGEQVNVILGANKYTCKKSFESVKGLYAVNENRSLIVNFKCPDISKFKKYATQTACPDNCNWNGFCSKGKCICFEGYDSSSNCAKDAEVKINDNMFSENTSIVLQVGKPGE